MFKATTSQIFKPLYRGEIDWKHPLSKNLQACWLFNEGHGNSTFDLVKNATLRFNGLASYSGGKNGSAIEFDGTTSFLQSEQNSFINFWPALTIETWLWASTEQPSQYNRVFEKGGNNEVTVVLNYTLNNDAISIQNLGDTAELFASTTRIADYKWHHVVVTIAINGTNNVKLYIDGRLDNQGTSNQPGTKNGLISLGKDNVGEDRYLKGKELFLRLWHRALTPAEIYWLYRDPYAMIY